MAARPHWATAPGSCISSSSVAVRQVAKNQPLLDRLWIEGDTAMSTFGLVITLELAARMRLVAGKEVTAVIKSTEFLVVTEQPWESLWLSRGAELHQNAGIYSTARLILGIATVAAVPVAHAGGLL
jgi:hypothetical protein